MRPQAPGEGATELSWIDCPKGLVSWLARSRSTFASEPFGLLRATSHRPHPVSSHRPTPLGAKCQRPIRI